MQRWIVACALVAAGCASNYTIPSRGSIVVSDNATVVAHNLIPNADRFPLAIKHLALAQEVYEAQLNLLKQRRNKVRSRGRYLSALSYVTFAGSSLGVGLTAVASDGADAEHDLRSAGYASLGGFAVGTMLHYIGAQQESPHEIDNKIDTLQKAYRIMLDRVRELAAVEVVDEQSARIVEAQMGPIIEAFISEALEINIKG